MVSIFLVWLAGSLGTLFSFLHFGQKKQARGGPIFRQTLSFLSLSSSLTLSRLFALSNLSLSPLCGCTQWQRESESERVAVVCSSIHGIGTLVGHTFRQTYTNMQKKRGQIDQSRPWRHGDLRGLVGVHSNKMERRKRVEGLIHMLANSSRLEGLSGKEQIDLRGVPIWPPSNRN